MMKLRVAHVMAGSAGGGAELFFERLAAAQHQAGDTVFPVIRAEPGRTARLAQAGLTPRTLRFGGALDVVTRFRLRTLLQAEAPHVVVAWMNRAARFTPRGAWALVGRLGGYYDLGYYRRCDHLVGNTPMLRDWIVAQGWPAARAHYLPNFVPDLAGCPADRLGVPPGAKLVAASGRLHRNKAFDVLIRAMVRLPGVHLVIAGDGPERAALTALARSEHLMDRVHLPGWIADTAGLLAGCDVFVCPSRHEPLGNVVLEAWSAARPVVAAASDGPRGLILPGETGLLVPLEDAEALALSLGTVLENPVLARTLARNGRAQWQSGYAQAPVLARWRAFLCGVEKA